MRPAAKFAASPTAQPAGSPAAKANPPAGSKRAGESAARANSQNLDLQGPFYIVDESPLQVLKIYEALSGKSAIISAQVPDVKINFNAPKMPRAEALAALKSLLAVNGVAINDIDSKFFRATPAVSMNAQSPEFISGRAADLPPSQNFYSKMFSLKYLDVDSLKDLINTFISPNGVATLTVFSRNNSFFLTDTLSNIQRVEMLLENLDKPTEVNEDITFIALKNMSSEDMKRRLMTMQGDFLKKYFGKASIDSDERTNQLIVVSPRGTSEIVKKIVEKLDIDSQPITRSRVFYIKHGESKNVATVLNQIVKGQQNAVRQANQQRSAQANQMNINNRIANAINRSNAARGGAVAAQMPMNILADFANAPLQFSEYITIVADDRSNSIVCYGTPGDLAQIEKIISEVDIVLNQVKIDVIITEVTLSDRQVSGLSTFGLNYQLAGTTTLSKGWSGNTATWSPDDSSTTGAFTVSASEQGFEAVFSVARQNSSVKILSSPSIVTTHNKDATVNVSKSYPILQSITSTYTGSTPYSTSNVTWKDIGIILEVTPLIGDNGVVQMEITQTVTTVIDYTTIDTSTQPIIGKREAESFVSAKAGETIVLAGLQQTNKNKTDGSVWLLGDIPGIGELFKPDKTVEERTELIIFIRPTLVKSEAHSSLLTDKTLDSSVVGKNVRNYFKTGRFEKESIRNSVDESLIERIQKRKYEPNDGLNPDAFSEEDESVPAPETPESDSGAGTERNPAAGAEPDSGADSALDAGANSGLQPAGGAVSETPQTSSEAGGASAEDAAVEPPASSASSSGISPSGGAVRTPEVSSLRASSTSPVLSGGEYGAGLEKAAPSTRIRRTSGQKR